MRTSSEILLLSFIIHGPCTVLCVGTSLPKHLNKKSIKKALTKPRYLKAFPPHHLQWRKAILVDWMLHDVICWHLRPSLDSLDHLSSQNCVAQQAWEIGKVSALKYLKSGMANLRDVTNVVPSNHQITKPSNTHASARDQSTRVLCHRGHDVTQQNHGLLGCQEIHQPDSLSRWSCIPLLGHGLPQSLWERFCFFPTSEKAWKSVTASETAMYIQLRSPYVATRHVQSFQSSSLLAAPWAENVSCSPHCSGARCQRMYARSPTPTVLYFSENWQMASATKTLSNQKSFREEMLFAYLPSNVSKGKDMVAHRPPVESTLSCPTLPPTVPTCKQKLHIRHPNTNSVQDFWPSKVFGKTEGIWIIAKILGKSVWLHPIDNTKLPSHTMSQLVSSLTPSISTTYPMA